MGTGSLTLDAWARNFFAILEEGLPAAKCFRTLMAKDCDPVVILELLYRAGIATARRRYDREFSRLATKAIKMTRKTAKQMQTINNFKVFGEFSIVQQFEWHSVLIRDDMNRRISGQDLFKRLPVFMEAYATLLSELGSHKAPSSLPEHEELMLAMVYVRQVTSTPHLGELASLYEVSEQAFGRTTDVKPNSLSKVFHRSVERFDKRFEGLIQQYLLARSKEGKNSPRSLVYFRRRFITERLRHLLLDPDRDKVK